MSANLSKDKAEASAELGFLSKLLAAIKKMLTTEFLWFLLAMVLGLPFAILLEYIITSNGMLKLEKEIEELLGFETLFLSCYVLCIGGIYFSRVVMNSFVSFFSKST